MGAILKNHPALLVVPQLALILACEEGALSSA